MSCENRQYSLLRCVLLWICFQKEGNILFSRNKCCHLAKTRLSMVVSYSIILIQFPFEETLLDHVRIIWTSRSLGGGTNPKYKLLRFLTTMNHFTRRHKLSTGIGADTFHSVYGSILEYQLLWVQDMFFSTFFVKKIYKICKTLQLSTHWGETREKLQRYY